MTGLAKGEQAAVEAVARHVSATWEAGGGAWPGAWLTLDGRRIAVEVAVIGDVGPKPRPKLRLRFDKVALRLVADLRSRLATAVPDGEALAFTVTAPIRLASKTATAIEALVRERLAHPPPREDLKETICGNHVQVRFVAGVSHRMPKATGFIHNPDPHSSLLLDVSEALLKSMGAAADRRAPETFAAGRWLIVVDPADQAPIETWRQVYAQLSAPADFTRILVVRHDGRVERLAG